MVKAGLFYLSLFAGNTYSCPALTAQIEVQMSACVMFSSCSQTI